MAPDRRDARLNHQPLAASFPENEPLFLPEAGRGLPVAG
jgi:hypothetical protein